MANNKGKKWEEKFKESWENFFPNTVILRLPDQQSRYKGTSKNPCDFIAFPTDKLFMIELKSHKSNTFPFSCFKQYDLLLSYKGAHRTICCVIVWFTDYNRVVYAPIEEVEKMINDGKKSINIKWLDTKEYNIVELPSGMTKKSIKYPKCDFTYIQNL